MDSNLLHVSSADGSTPGREILDSTNNTMVNESLSNNTIADQLGDILINSIIENEDMVVLQDERSELNGGTSIGAANLRNCVVIPISSTPIRPVDENLHIEKVANIQHPATVDLEPALNAGQTNVITTKCPPPSDPVSIVTRAELQDAVRAAVAELQTNGMNGSPAIPESSIVAVADVHANTQLAGINAIH